MRRSSLATRAVILVIVALSACSSNHDTNPPATTAAPTSEAGATSSAARIVSLTGPPTPPVCNAPTQVELHWSTQGAKTVSLRINDGPVFATYPNGKADELVPLACDGNPQTYLLTARDAGGHVTTKTLTITARELSAS